ncbi:hypothetical protein AB835_01990 [Candidatus Endobugula sertula]|uniref:PilZ domain-containing protein n=1 Tax=Candidatus Endobugula sertula TaxID=62101 RepID=A0A1D2QT17_9GAMM|nr:hypothetical protein AB835_01990 [Candidatus Endobugula sertula]
MSTENFEGSTENTKNDRKSKRYRVGWASRVMLPDRRIVAARTKDVSEGGIAFELDEAIPLGAHVNIELNPWHEGVQYAIRAKVVITYNMIMSGDSGFSHGLKFTFIPSEQLQQLKKFFKSMD